MTWPRTLFGRNLVLMVALILASELAWLGIFRVMVQNPRLERVAFFIRDYADGLRDALRLLPEEKRAAYLGALQAKDPMRLVPATDAPARFSRPTGARARLLLGPLANALGPGYALRWEERPVRRMWVRTRLGDDEYWIGFATQGMVPDWSALLLAGSGATVLLAGIGAWLVQRRINRPLQTLAEAAAALGRGERRPPLPPDAPDEIAVVGKSFERMAASLAQADAERALMLAGVSHDLRTPLSKLRLCIEMLPPQTDPELLASMTRSIATADEIVGQFVDFARADSAEAPQWCDPAELVRSVVDTIATADEIGVEFGDLPPMELRPLALRRALANLIGNAQRYAPGNIIVRARTEKGVARFSVLDRGPGIPPERMTQARQPFTRLQAARGDIPGAGLGLAIVDRVARMHGGVLTLSNRDGGGLDAAIEIPAGRGQGVR